MPARSRESPAHEVCRPRPRVYRRPSSLPPAVYLYKNTVFRKPGEPTMYSTVRLIFRSKQAPAAVPREEPTLPEFAGELGDVGGGAAAYHSPEASELENAIDAQVRVRVPLSPRKSAPTSHDAASPRPSLVGSAEPAVPAATWRYVVAYATMSLFALVGGFITASVGSGSDIALYAFGIVVWNNLMGADLQMDDNKFTASSVVVMGAMSLVTVCIRGQLQVRAHLLCALLENRSLTEASGFPARPPPPPLAAAGSRVLSAPMAPAPPSPPLPPPHSQL